MSRGRAKGGRGGVQVGINAFFGLAERGEFGSRVARDRRPLEEACRAHHRLWRRREPRWPAPRRRMAEAQQRALGDPEPQHRMKANVPIIASRWKARVVAGMAALVALALPLIAPCSLGDCVAHRASRWDASSVRTRGGSLLSMLDLASATVFANRDVLCGDRRFAVQLRRRGSLRTRSRSTSVRHAKPTS